MTTPRLTFLSRLNFFLHQFVSLRYDSNQPSSLRANCEGVQFHPISTKMPIPSQWLLWLTLVPLVLSLSSKPDEPSQPAPGDVTISDITDACRDHSYRTHLISEDPLVIYIESFVTPEEASQLTDLSFALPFPPKSKSNFLPAKASSNLHPSGQTMAKSPSIPTTAPP